MQNNKQILNLTKNGAKNKKSYDATKMGPPQNAWSFMVSSANNLHVILSFFFCKYQNTEIEIP